VLSQGQQRQSRSFTWRCCHQCGVTHHDIGGQHSNLSEARENSLITRSSYCFEEEEEELGLLFDRVISGIHRTTPATTLRKLYVT